MRREPDARGNVSVFVAVVIVLAFLLCGALARLGGAAATKARANAAADASALAAADGLALGHSATRACASAASIATENGARLVACQGSAPGAAAGYADVVVALGEARASARSEVDPIVYDTATVP